MKFARPSFVMNNGFYAVAFYLLLVSVFGVGGLSGLAAVSSISLGLSSAFVFTAFLLYRENTKGHLESEETI